ncbi:uncharacterized protein JCM10292_004765 [Rhodotorula paludigena]|uniref:uncharacterized protein n=1 Tax=Rhodotorula paludigena TaxID=86838 RepID=UPI0031731E74
MEYDKKLRPESLKRNGYHLFVDLLDRIIHESTTQAMRSACRALWRYMTSYWLKLTVEKIAELNQRLIGVKNVWEQLDLYRLGCTAPLSYNKELAEFPENWDAYINEMHNSHVRPSLPWAVLFKGMGSVPPVDLRARRGHSIEPSVEQERWKKCAEEMAKARNWHDCIVAQDDGLVAWGHPRGHNPFAEEENSSAREETEAGRTSPGREPHEHHGWTAVNTHPHHDASAHPSSSANSLARISHYYAAKHYRLNGRRWEMRAQL